MTRSPRSLWLLAVSLAAIAACGSGASSQATPIAPPPAGTPIAAPDGAGGSAGTPVAGPSDRGQPVAHPGQAAPVAQSAQATAVAPPTSGTPVAAPQQTGDAPRATPVAAPPAGQTTSGMPVAGPSGGGAPSGPAATILAAHNAYRARHCAPPMRWSAAIADVAQRYANELAQSGCAFRHSRSRYGENLMRFAPAGSHDASYVVSAWYEEVSAYDYAHPGFSMNTGHFTQVVWSESTELGCGVAVCDGGETWVCNYGPPGNVTGRFPANVRPATCQ
ncbi:MAG: CAP domain-containing protein [Polyangiales bacterium]|nr:hypothetical protein [Myxococcales bacterium]MCB9660939.1 hypothetical protein [Sandaracinaceae bacterium]